MFFPRQKPIITLENIKNALPRFDSIKAAVGKSAAIGQDLLRGNAQMEKHCTHGAVNAPSIKITAAAENRKECCL